MQDACVSLLSDFGTRDVYVGVMKAVLARIAPRALLIDLTHEIPRGDIRQAAFRLWQALPYVPAGTIFLAVVDPGVGTSRRPLAVRAEGFSCVGPDNGIFTYVLANQRNARAVVIDRPGLSANATFHGRDVFAPAAGLLAAGTELERIGAEAADPARIPWPLLSLHSRDHSVRGEALFADWFGNIITSIGRLIRLDSNVRLEPWVPSEWAPLEVTSSRFRVLLGGGREIPVVRTYGEVRAGQPLAYIGSDGLLEIAVNQGSAAEALGLAAGSEINLSWQ
ncbi:MAG TPA: SAM-dependent chlorinase/fluorinase [Spirochaetia bacterium]|nr:SAM-dependent chlorinase/fluorinase [Spirochaetia bacterium]